jgi:hypothetical protein
MKEACGEPGITYRFASDSRNWLDAARRLWHDPAVRRALRITAGGLIRNLLN